MKFLYTFLILGILVCGSCSSDDGLDADTVGRTFEFTVGSFSPANNFSVNTTVPNSVEVLNSDVALVYVLDPIRSSEINSDVWEPLPRTFFFADGGFAQFQFNFVFNSAANIADIEIFLESDNLNALNADITTNQTFRIVIVPATFAQNATVDLADLNAVEAALQTLPLP